MPGPPSIFSRDSPFSKSIPSFQSRSKNDPSSIQLPWRKWLDFWTTEARTTRKRYSHSSSAVQRSSSLTVIHPSYRTPFPARTGTLQNNCFTFSFNTPIDFFTFALLLIIIVLLDGQLALSSHQKFVGFPSPLLSKWLKKAMKMITTIRRMAMANGRRLIPKLYHKASMVWEYRLLHLDQWRWLRRGARMELWTVHLFHSK